jgi:hypothetical protein
MQAAAAPPVMFNKWVLGRRPFLHFKLSRAVACAADTRIPSNTVKAAHSTSSAVSHEESCCLQKAAHSTNAALEEEVKKENKCSSVQQLSTTTIITPTLVPDLFLESSSILDDEMEDILETEDADDDDDDDDDDAESVLESAAIVVGAAEEEVMEVMPVFSPTNKHLVVNFILQSDESTDVGIYLECFERYWIIWKQPIAKKFLGEWGLRVEHGFVVSNR